MNRAVASRQVLKALDDIAAALRRIDEPGVVSSLPPDVQEMIDHSALSALDASGVAKLSNAIAERVQQ